MQHQPPRYLRYSHLNRNQLLDELISRDDELRAVRKPEHDAHAAWQRGYETGWSDHLAVIH